MSRLPQQKITMCSIVVFCWTIHFSVFMIIDMLSGVRVYTSDIIWRQILTDLNARVLDAPSMMDVNLDELNITTPISPIGLKSAILDALDSTKILNTIFGHSVSLPHLQAQIVVWLYKTGGMSVNELKNALGYAPDAATHTVDTAIYQLRKVYGRQFIQTNNGVYSLGKI